MPYMAQNDILIVDDEMDICYLLTGILKQKNYSSSFANTISDAQKAIEKAPAKSYFDVLWESSYLYAGTGPILEENIIDGMSRLKASIGFDIYQIDGDDADEN